MASKKKKKDSKAQVTAPQQPMTSKDVMAVMKKLDKERGTKSIALEKKKASDFCSTGLLCLDLSMGGGYYGGQAFQIFGPAGVGKSSSLYKSAAWATKVARIPSAYRDHEGTTDRAYVERLGVDFDMVLYERPETGEDTYDWIDSFCSRLPDKYSGMPQAIIFIDTIKAMKPKKWMADEDPDNKQPAIQASMHSRGWDRIQTLITNKHVSIVAANQVRSNAGNPYGASEIVPGGKAWEFGTSNLVRAGRGKKGVVELPDGRVLQHVSFKTYKNKNFIPGQECSVFLELGVGFDLASDVIEFCKMAGFYDRRDRNKAGQPMGPPLLRGLDRFLSEAGLPTGVDRQFASAAEMEEAIRAEGTDGLIYKACRLSLETGVAIEMFRASKKKDGASQEDTGLLGVKKTKKASIDDDVSDADEPDFDEEAEDEAEIESTADEAAEDEEEPAAKLGKARQATAEPDLVDDEPQVTVAQPEAAQPRIVPSRKKAKKKAAKKKSTAKKKVVGNETATAV